ncbi:hypothetical protein HMPREF0239_04621, partial [Clostridium sp. ATCC BAA-442]
IHAPREGCDEIFVKTFTTEKYFNPRTPRGVRLQVQEVGLF